VKGAAMDFSFSGVMTAVANFLGASRRQPPLTKISRRSFQEAVVDMLIRPTSQLRTSNRRNNRRADRRVAANSRMRERLTQALEPRIGASLHPRCDTAPTMPR